MASRRRSKKGKLPPLATLLTVGGGVAVGVVALVLLAAGWSRYTGPAGADEPQRTFQPGKEKEEVKKEGGGFPIALVIRPTELLEEPDGRRIARISTTTEYESPRILPVVGERPGWLRVISTEVENGKTGWIPAEDVKVGDIPFSLRVDLSERRIEVRRNGKTVRTFPTAVGQPQYPTPTGRFAVTDKLEVTDPASPYGCCALALSGHQPEIKQGWSGGDRLAIHATPDPSSIGKAVSLGCMRAPTEDMLWMVDKVPTGTIVEIKN